MEIVSELVSGAIVFLAIALDPAVAYFAALPVVILVGMASFGIGWFLGKVAERIVREHHAIARRGGSLACAQGKSAGCHKQFGSETHQISPVAMQSRPARNWYDLLALYSLVEKLQAFIPEVFDTYVVRGARIELATSSTSMMRSTK
jgi:hypothetical protein